MLNKKIVLPAALIWTSIVTVLSLIAIGDVGSGITIPYKDKYVHFLFYFVLVLLWTLYSKSKKLKAKINLIVLFAAIGYGILMEIFQAVFTTTRTADIYDVMANSLGAVSGLLFLNFFYKKQEATH